jgi:carbon monoxide dehydrogenase subunit G
MEMTGSQALPVVQAIAWEALNDPAILKAAIPGCEQLDRVSETEFVAAVTAAIGPVKAKFKANLSLSEVVAPNAYTIRFDGQGGAAGFGKGDARVLLVPEGQSTRLDYTVKANVGGKLAQIGSRLIDAAAKKMADDFFVRFTRELAARNPAGSVEEVPETIATSSAMASAPALPGPAEGVGTRSRIGLGIVAAIVLALIVYIAGRM